jgi:hypothetical protein
VLPVFPALCALAAGALVAGAARVTPAGRRLLPVLVVAVALYGLAFARQQLVFHPAGEWKYPAVGAYIARHLPDRAVFLAMHHSGSVRYYTGRATVRYDLLPPSGLDAAIAALRARGYRRYILLDAMEEDAFRAHLAAGSRWGALDWAPLAVIEPDSVRIYRSGGARVSGRYVADFAAPGAGRGLPAGDFRSTSMRPLNMAPSRRTTAGVVSVPVTWAVSVSSTRPVARTLPAIVPCTITWCPCTSASMWPVGAMTRAPSSIWIWPLTRPCTVMSS